MKQTTFIFAFVVAALAALAGCSDATSPPSRVLDGQYGGDGVALDVAASVTHLSFDCAAGEIDAPIALDGDGRFDVAGTWTGEGNAVNADHTPHAVRYAGRATRDVVRLTIVGLGAAPTDTLVAVLDGPRFVAAC